MIVRSIITIGVQNYGRAWGNEGGLHIVMVLYERIVEKYRNIG